MLHTMSTPELQETGVPDWLQPVKEDHGTFYTEQTWEDLLDRVRAGENLMDICEDPRMPTKSVLVKWITIDPKKEEAFYEAQRIGTLILQDKLLKVAEGLDSPIDADVQRARLHIEGLQFALRTRFRERYGDRKQVDINETVDIRVAMDNARERVRLVGRGPALIEGEVVDGATP